MNSATELLPCPFCGGEAEVHPSSDWNTRFSGKTFFAWCDKCETRGDCYNTEAEAIAAWNTRAPVEYEGWFYLPKPKNSLVHYGTPQIEKTENGYKAKQPVEVIESAIRAWGDELGEHIMKRICEVWNTRTHGTLTAEQVREAIERSITFYEGGDYDEKAIADELNAELGSGTCRLDETASYSNANEVIHLLECSECGRTCEHVNGSYPRCPHCGARVKEGGDD